MGTKPATLKLRSKPMKSRKLAALIREHIDTIRRSGGGPLGQMPESITVDVRAANYSGTRAIHVRLGGVPADWWIHEQLFDEPCAIAGPRLAAVRATLARLLRDYFHAQFPDGYFTVKADGHGLTGTPLMHI